MKIFKVLDEKKIYYNDNRDKLSKRLIYDKDMDFVLKFANDTVKIDGNSMTYYESKTILEDGYAIGGNERTARLLMNYILMSFEFLPISIKPSIVSEYYSSLDDFGCSGNLNNFVKLVSRWKKSD